MAELSSAVSSFLMSEPKRNRMIFVRRYWYYDSIESISEAFGISSGTAGSILFRMRKRLKKYLQKEGYDL
ncbi:sigma factor-like helix-turn-helix DNA-binding protein [Ruminococcus sp.]|uniref:RNA polymerase sigma factor n=1 Tax=Ruminococcus sp. TaxID=41978 RepID=UPI0025D7A688|nr:sigma factor-like helix-turn-helix DNA-binding protein [Ruminococcus sp.]